MARTTVTEADLGLEVTEEELASAIPEVNDDDISLEDDPQLEQQQAKPEEPAEPAKPEDPKPDEGKTVDLRALQEARSEAREAKRYATTLEQRWNDFLAGQRGAQQPEKATAEPEIPDPDKDPLGAVKWVKDFITKQQAQAQETATQAAQRQQEEHAFQQAYHQASTDYAAAVETDPTFAPLYGALRESQGKELLAMGYSVPQAKAELDRMERAHIQYAVSSGLNIADHIRALATARGLSAQAPTQQPEKAKIDPAAIAAQQQRHQSLSDAPGGEAPPVLDAKALGRMSDKEFKAWMSQKGNEAKFDQIMGKS